MNLEKEIFDIALQDIIPNRFQPREMFDDEALKELSQSIREHGVIQPIIVRKVGDKYEIIAGERRFRASQLAGKSTIPALVRDIDDKEAAKIALLENLQRSNLTAIEEAKTYQTILKLDNITQEELAQNLGKSQSTIANKLRLLTLDEDVQTALLNSQISERHARSLIGLDITKQNELLQKILNEKLTVRQLDEEIMRITGKISTGAENSINNKPLEGSVAYSIPQNNQYEPINQSLQENNPLESQINVAPTEQPITIEQPISPNNDIPHAHTQNDQISHEISVDNNNLEVEPQQSIEQKEQNIITPNTIEQPKENIFDKLRIQTPNLDTIEKDKENDIENTSPTINAVSETNKSDDAFNNIYDLRFAINNFRQAIQNTSKFGFKVKADEYDSPEKYQIVIEIEKKN